MGAEDVEKTDGREQGGEKRAREERESARLSGVEAGAAQAKSPKLVAVQAPDETAQGRREGT